MNEKTIDYLVVNAKEIPAIFTVIDREPSYLKNYQWMLKASCGATIHYENPVTEKFHCVLSGTPCRTWQAKLGTHGMLESLIKSSDTVTRLDLAITQFIDADGIITVDEVMAWYYDNKIECKHAKHGSSLFQSDAPNELDEKVLIGKTFYVGQWSRRAKHGIFRAYDKSLEMDIGLYENSIVRLEIEDKRKDAQISAKRLIEGATIAQVFKTRFDVQDEKFQKLLDCESIDITRGKSQEQLDSDEKKVKNASRWNWLINQVAPSLGRALADDMMDYDIGSVNYDLFTEQVYKYYQMHVRDNT